MLIDCPSDVIHATLELLRRAGLGGREGIVLWLGQRADEHIQVTDVYQPLHTSKSDMFHITPAGMNALHKELRNRRRMVAAQVHTHPGRAYHSKADDRWAIIRHVGALSLVLPHFAFDTTVETFLEAAKVYRFSENSSWLLVPQNHLNGQCLTIS